MSHDEHVLMRSRWICIRVDALGGLFAAGLAAVGLVASTSCLSFDMIFQYLVYGRPDENASDTGFSITMAVTFSGMILWWVRVLNEFEGEWLPIRLHSIAYARDSCREQVGCDWLNVKDVLTHFWLCSLERIQEYTVIEQEPKPTEGGAPPAWWPASGDIRVEKLSARYSAVSCFGAYASQPTVQRQCQDGPKVLHDISFHIKSGERVGVGTWLLRDVL
jgi:ABC-type multidrug transport system fused ATPase/permease subunit